MTTKVSMGQVKRDISDQVNRVAYSGERIVLTSRGKPKAVIVSLDDYARLKEAEEKTQIKYREKWLADSRSLAIQIRESHGNKLIDIDAIIAMDKRIFQYQKTRKLTTIPHKLQSHLHPQSFALYAAGGQSGNQSPIHQRVIS